MELKFILCPRNDVVSANRLGAYRGAFLTLSGADVNVNNVQSPMVNEYPNLAILEVIETAASKRIPVCSEVLDGWGKVQFAVKPRLDGMLIGGDDIHQVIG